MAASDSELVSARDGAGPLLQRDYWAAIADPAEGPQGLARFVTRRFPEIAPPSLAGFRRRGGDEPLAVGDEMDVRIRPVGTVGVRVVHTDDNSLTVATLAGHPEAGRITFGAYRHDDGEVIFHIRSRARSSSRRRLAGFLALGDPMQTFTWTDFLNRLAWMAGDGVLGLVQARTRKVAETDEDGPAGLARPTFRAEGE